MVDDFRFVRSHKVVEARYRERWLRGRLQAWWRDQGRWRALVTFSHHNGVTQPKVFDQDEIRPRG
jgi:hypothetical protein